MHIWTYLNKYKRTLTHKAIEIGSSVDGSLYDEWVVRICDCHQLKYIYRYDYPGLNVHDDERLLWFNCLRRDLTLLSNATRNIYTTKIVVEIVCVGIKLWITWQAACRLYTCIAYNLFTFICAAGRRKIEVTFVIFCVRRHKRRLCRRRFEPISCCYHLRVSQQRCHGIMSHSHDSGK